MFRGMLLPLGMLASSMGFAQSNPSSESRNQISVPFVGLRSRRSDGASEGSRWQERACTYLCRCRKSARLLQIRRGARRSRAPGLALLRCVWVEWIADLGYPHA